MLHPERFSAFRRVQNRTHLRNFVSNDRNPAGVSDVDGCPRGSFELNVPYSDLRSHQRGGGLHAFEGHMSMLDLRAGSRRVINRANNFHILGYGDAASLPKIEYSL